MTVRFGDRLAEDLETAAAVDGLPVAEVVRRACLEHIRARQSDPAFRAGLRRQAGKAQRLLSTEVR